MLQPKLLSVEPMANYKLRLTYETGEIKEFDVKPYISGSWFGMLADKEYFKAVRLTRNGIEWQDEQDIAPHELYQNSIAWDPDYTKVTKAEAKRIAEAEQGEFVNFDDVDWDNLSKYAN